MAPSSSPRPAEMSGSETSLPVTSDVASFTLQIDGQPLPDAYSAVSIDVWTGHGSPPKARIVMIHDDPATAIRLLAMDAAVEISLGYSGADTSVFTGKIYSQSLDIAADAKPSLTVEALDPVATSPAATGARSPALTLTYGRSVLGFHGEVEHAAANNRTTVRGTVRFPGSPLARPGDLIALGGFCHPFDGNVQVVAVHHHVAYGTWSTTVGFGSAPPGGR